MPSANDLTTKLQTVVIALAGVALTVYAVMPHKAVTAPEPTPTVKPAVLPEAYKNATWIWDSPLNMETQAMQDQITFAKDNNIKVIYLYIEDYFTILENPMLPDKTSAVADFNAKVKEFLSIANQNGIEVEGLAGDVSWADDSKSYIPNKLLDYVLDFNANADNPQKFAGMQFDIEFYNKEKFKSTVVESETHYLNLITALSDKVKKSGQTNVRLGFAVPFWLDKADGVAPHVVFNGKDQTMFEHLLAILHDTNAYLALMSYRNQASGDNGSIAISSRDVELADAKGGSVKIYIGMETEDNKIKTITFYSKSLADFREAAKEITAAFAPSSSFAGIAVHTLKGYRAIAEK